MRAALAPKRRHNHRLCVEDALDRAEAVCAARGARLTPIRRRVLEIVWGQHQPIGAYAILEALHGKAGVGAAAPPTVYRALDFLIAQGLVHRLESLNAYIGCPQPGANHASQFLICTGCGEVTEIEGSRIAASARRQAAARGFSLDRLTIELAGRCPHCANPPRPPFLLSPRPLKGGEGQGEGVLSAASSLPPTPHPSPPRGGGGGKRWKRA
jgi:Fur family zinc uptake transcriptional regulator